MEQFSFFSSLVGNAASINRNGLRMTVGNLKDELNKYSKKLIQKNTETLPKT